MCETSREREVALDEAELHRIRSLLMTMATGELLYLAFCVNAEELVEQVRLLLAPHSAK